MTATDDHVIGMKRHSLEHLLEMRKALLMLEAGVTVQRMRAVSPTSCDLVLQHVVPEQQLDPNDTVAFLDLRQTCQPIYHSGAIASFIHLLRRAVCTSDIQKQQPLTNNRPTIRLLPNVQTIKSYRQ